MGRILVGKKQLLTADPQDQAAVGFGHGLRGKDPMLLKHPHYTPEYERGYKLYKKAKTKRLLRGQSTSKKSFQARVQARPTRLGKTY